MRNYNHVTVKKMQAPFDSNVKKAGILTVQGHFFVGEI
jgi:hypothetical protein